ncbi:DUF2938 family protein [Mesorhizobium sp. M4B.F.Ca.ET.190.01.1.1]|uniref:DUF2938 family protein n=1 Tax=unclassified Mesorhizobium TaxID=325217 RepID=UPI001093195F|nr:MULTISPECIES: DUF2938 family protein [unclassified Mesorhizobium]TGR10539.1 DUF2938 family protein [Mesorhizobium sp. M4B.F.Ca.ET.200.01.1.1]TGS19629.1 DUF2938 family protein [Mesorhizobium sp. M4B.F.Ca.ET.190.01.1.1]TGT32405.1 DUF2938 family protein [Mesorhizobium sp. M4B.F.Ca.ET.172.01.1.1]
MDLSVENLLLYGCLIGLGATVVMDLWGIALKISMGQPLPNFKILGRWLGHALRGKFFHVAIGDSPKVPQEFPLGIVLHAGVGAAFGIGLLLLAGPHWLEYPSFWPAILWGLFTISFPWFFFQPALGLGVAAAKVTNRRRALIVGLSNHIVFGFGLWLSALAMAVI